MRRYVIFLIILTIFLSSCKNTSTAPLITDTLQEIAATENNDTYPAPESGEYPVPGHNISTNRVKSDLLKPEIIKPERGKGNLHGFLLYQEEDASLYGYKGMQIYLGIILTSNRENTSLGRVDSDNAPTAVVLPNGFFAFENIEPGEYILIIRMPPDNLVMLVDPDTEDDLIYTIKSNKSTDVGSLIYPDGINGLFP